jgi:hypothetical protein
VTALNGIDVHISNSNSGHIVTGANVLYSVGGTTSTTGLVEYIDNSNGGAIDNGGNVTLLTVGPVMLDGGFSLETDNFNGGTINNGADVTAHFVGDVTATIGSGHSFNFFVVNGGNDFVGDLGGGTIGTGGNIDATFDGNAATTPTATTGSFAAEIANDRGSIVTGGNISLTIGGNVNCSGLFVYTSNRYGGQIGTGGNVTFDVVGNVTTADQAFFGVQNNGGTIGSGTNVTVNIGRDLTTQTGAFFQILNNDDGSGSGPGTIGSNATISVGAGSISTAGALDAEIDNYSGGTIGGNANLNFNLTGALTTQGGAIFLINNFGDIEFGRGGTVGGDAAISVTAANITAGSLLAQIDNSNSGTIGGDATISMNVSGSAAVTNDATFQILGSDGTAAAAINFNGGNYDAGGTFLAYIDGNGAITFNNASAHADILKAGVFGANGVLNIGGGTLSADTTLKLYAPGSNGQLNFVSNVTLGGNAAKILAANSITIFDNVVVTIGGKAPADVYTNNANYSEKWGGNGTTTGTFAGAGANRPQPLSDAPPFDALSPGNPTNGKRSKTVINIPNSGQLLSLLEGSVPGPDGRLRVPRDKQRHAANADRLNVNRMIKADRDMADVRHMRDRGVINNRLGSGTRAC